MKRKTTAILSATFLLFILGLSGGFPAARASDYKGSGPYPPNVKGPGFVQIRFYGFADDVGEFTALKAGTIDMMDVETPTSSAAAAVAANGTTLNTYASQEYGWWGWAVDSLRFPTNFTAFRIAMSHLYNKAAAATELAGNGIVLDTWTAPPFYGNYSLQSNPYAAALPGHQLTITLAASTARPTTGGFSGTIVQSIPDPATITYTNPNSHFFYSPDVALAVLKAGGFTEDGSGNWFAPNGQPFAAPSTCDYNDLNANGNGIIIEHRSQTSRPIMIAMYNAFHASLMGLNATADTSMTHGWGKLSEGFGAGNYWCELAIASRSQISTGTLRDLDLGLFADHTNFYTAGWSLTTTPDFIVFTEHTPDNVVTTVANNEDDISNITFDRVSEEFEFNNLNLAREVELSWALQAISYQNGYDGSMWSPNTIQAASIKLEGFLNSPAGVQIYPGFWNQLNMRTTGGGYGYTLNEGLLGGFVDLNYVTAHFVYDFEALGLVYDVPNWAIDPNTKLSYNYASTGDAGAPGSGVAIIEPYSGPLNNGAVGTHIRWLQSNQLFFHDGTHVTGNDTVFSYYFLKNKPVYASSLGTLTNITATDTGDKLFRQIDLYAVGRSFFALNLFNVAVLPKHIWCGDDGFDPTKPTNLQSASKLAGGCPEVSGSDADIISSLGGASIAGWFSIAGGAYSNICADSTCTTPPAWHVFNPTTRHIYSDGVTKYGTYSYGGRTVQLTAMVGSGPYVWGDDYNPSIPTGTILAFNKYILFDHGLDAVTPPASPVFGFLILPALAAIALVSALTAKRAKKI